MSLLYERALKMLPKINTILKFLPTRKLKTKFHRRNTSYNTTLMLQCKIMQHNNGGTVQ